MPNAAKAYTGRELLDKLISDLVDYNFQIGSLQGTKIRGDYTQKEAVYEKNLRQGAFLTMMQIKKILDDLYETKHRMEGLDK